MYQIRSFRKYKYASQVVKVKIQVFLRNGLIISLEATMMHLQKSMRLAHSYYHSILCFMDKQWDI